MSLFQAMLLYFVSGGFCIFIISFIISRLKIRAGIVPETNNSCKKTLREINTVYGYKAIEVLYRFGIKTGPLGAIFLCDIQQMCLSGDKIKLCRPKTLTQTVEEFNQVFFNRTVLVYSVAVEQENKLSIRACFLGELEDVIPLEDQVTL